MKKIGATAWLLVGLGSLLAACDNNPVEVAFQEPFPAGASNLRRFSPADQGRYPSLADTTEALLLGPASLVRQQWLPGRVTGQQLDSLALPRRAGRWRAGKRLFRVQPLAADSFQLSEQQLDTVFALGSSRLGILRRYQGWYYLNLPDPDRPGRWQLTRLAAGSARLRWQQFNPDSLRISALDTSAVRLKRASSQLLFTIWPRSRRAMRQVGSYAGLWLPLGDYGPAPKPH